MTDGSTAPTSLHDEAIHKHRASAREELLPERIEQNARAERD
jgi:hypothetical protein